MTGQLANSPLNARARLLEALASVLGVNAATLTEDSSPNSVPTWDSLNHLNIAMALESEFAITLTAEQVVAMDSIAAIGATLRTCGIDI